MERVILLLNTLDQMSDAEPAEAAARADEAAWLQVAAPEEVLFFLQCLLDRSPPENVATDAFLQAIFHNLILRQRTADEAGIPPLLLDEMAMALIATVYRHLESSSIAREYLLALLTGTRSPRALVELADILVEDPPRTSDLVAATFGPLFQHDDYDPAYLFPRMLQALQHSTVATLTLDLANFLTRKHRLAQHPAKRDVAVVASFLDALVGRLEELELSPPRDQKEVEQRSRQINEGVGLAVSLCDALALIGAPEVTNQLRRATGLKHRRLRVEASAALARLGDDSGTEMLVSLASEASVRLRVLAYADELDILDQVDEKYQTAEAQAESELVLWLAQPSQVGLPPTLCELIESRCLYWPGYNEPIDCFLFRFNYEMGDLSFSNIGIAGPAVYAFATDLSDLPPDDIFAAFAGWNAEHEEMYEFDVGEMHKDEMPQVARLERRLHDEGYQQIEPLKLCLFFGERVLVANARRDGRAGIAVADFNQTMWLPQSTSSRPPGANEAYCIYKGRRLLRSFNEEE